MSNLTPQQKVDLAVSLVKNWAPKFNWIWKSDSKLHRAIGWCFEKLGMPGYMTQYWTTLNQEVARPEEARVGFNDEWSVMTHEGRHAIDANKITYPLFAFIYGLPQILGLLAIPLAVLLVLVTHSWLGLLGLLALGLFAPIPALGRAWLELRGYRVSISCDYWRYGAPQSDDQYLAFYVECFSSSPYYYMAGPLLKNWVQKKLQSYLDDLKAGNGFQGDAYLTSVRDLALSFAKEDSTN